MQSSVKASPAYFKNLDGLRFIAAFFVIVGHSQSMIWDRLHANPYKHFADKLASFGVDFFFVLSGFLISFLLFEELAKTGTIHVRKFYIRRILRLWPLYFIFGYVSILTASHFIHALDLLDRGQTWEELKENLLYLTFFSTNFQILKGMNYPAHFTIGHFWSLSVEEQFYLVWAPLMWLFRKRVWLLLVLMLTIGAITTFWEPAIYKEWFKDNAYMTTYYITYSRFMFFGLGASLAYIIHKQAVIKTYLPINETVLKYAQIAFSIYVLIMSYRILFRAVYYTDVENRFMYALLSTGLVAMAVMKHTVINLEFRFLKYLGKISFGIYVFHYLSIHLVWFVLDKLDITGTLLYALLPSLATVLAVLFAAFSYQFIEKWFLKQKDKFKF